MADLSFNLVDFRKWHGLMSRTKDQAAHKVDIKRSDAGFSIDIDRDDAEKGVSLVCEFDSGRLKIVVAPADGGDATAIIVLGANGILVAPASGAHDWHRVNPGDGVSPLPISSVTVSDAIAADESHTPKNAM